MQPMPETTVPISTLPLVWNDISKYNAYDYALVFIAFISGAIALVFIDDEFRTLLLNACLLVSVETTTRLIKISLKSS